MTKIFEWIKENKLFAIYLGALLFLLPILSIFYINTISNFSFFNYLGISSDGIIAYVAGFLTLIGSVVLGMVAVQQNKEANEMNKRILDNEATRDAFTRQPCLMIKSWSVTELFCRDCYSHTIKYVCGDIGDFSEDVLLKQITIRLINASSALTECHLRSIIFKMKDGSKSIIDCLDSSINPVSFYQHYVPHGEMDVILLFRLDDLPALQLSKNGTIELDLTNSLGEKYQELITFVPILSIEPFFLTLVNPNYQVNREVYSRIDVNLV